MDLNGFFTLFLSIVVGLAVVGIFIRWLQDVTDPRNRNNAASSRFSSNTKSWNKRLNIDL